MTALTRQQLREIDRRSVEDYSIPSIILMENASRCAADSAMAMLANRTSPRVLIVCGGGNNGGDGLAVTRHLHNRGMKVSVALAIDPSRYTGDALINWRIIQAMQLPCQTATPELVRSRAWDLIIDAVFGTGLAQAPRDPFPSLADAINRSGLPVLAVDLPSGLDCDTGAAPGACIIASRTVTFVAPKVGFVNPAAAPFIGEVVVGDIGCPIELIDAVRTSVPL